MSGIPNLCEFLLAIVFLCLALKTRLFLAKSDIFIHKCTEGGGGASV